MSMCACSNFDNVLHPTEPYLSSYEAQSALIDYAEPQLAEAVGLPAWAFEMDDYRVAEATHYEEQGYWYFEIEGKIPMYDDGLWWIHYAFDAKVDDQTGYVTLGGLSIEK